jgi:glycosidase
MPMELTPTGLVKRYAGRQLTVLVSTETKVAQVELVCEELSLKLPMLPDDLGYFVDYTPDETGSFQFQVRYKQTKDADWQFLEDHGKPQTFELQVDPAWLAQVVFYCVFVRFFKGRVKQQVDRQPAVEQLAGIDAKELQGKSINPMDTVLPGEGGTFDDVKAHLDVIKSMGIKGLYFNPIHLIGEIYRGYNMLDQLPSYLQPGSPYSIKDYKSIDPELTYDKDTKKHLLSDPAQEFRDLVHAAHERGMYIIMDLVFNHTAHDFVLQRIRPEWYLYKEAITSLDEPYLYPEDIKQGKPWGDPKHSVPPYDHGVWWEDCAQLNWEYKITPSTNEPPKNQSLNEMWEYFKTVPQYWIKHFGVDGFRCDVAYRVPPDFWKECIQESRTVAKKTERNLASDVVFIAESYTSDLSELQHAGFAAVYGDFSHKVNRALDLKGYLDYIYNAGSADFPDGSSWFHFPDSHDFDRSPRKILGDKAGEGGPALLANQSRWVLTACLPGVPLVFNGFEKIEWQPINIWSYGAINWERDEDLRDYISMVNHIRATSVALQRGEYTFLETNQGLDEQTQLFAFERRFEDERILVVVNMDVYQPAGPAEVHLPIWYRGKKHRLVDLLTEQTFDRSNDILIVKLEPGSSHIFKVLS